MYFNNKKHILSNVLMAAAAINVVSAMLGGLMRVVVNNNISLTPDMADGILWKVQIVLSIIQLVLICIVFWLAFRQLNRYIGTVEDDDRAEMGRLQEEVFGTKLSALSADAIRRLLQIWAVILIGVEIVYDVTSTLYREFMLQLFSMELDFCMNAGDGQYVRMLVEEVNAQPEGATDGKSKGETCKEKT